ncbi:hypothetical protein [Ectobacillus panaciterrae]|uniref:hypothetical protein n=1 Tax=Ectobacillus panaciterrae TaxID=363872 RepID=UPI0004203E90|nr:hypothetical protein [Ectobacillus panaciterrae]
MKKLLFVVVSLLTTVALAACNKDSEHKQMQHDMANMNHNDSSKGKQQVAVQTDWKFDHDPESNTTNQLTITIKDNNGKPISEFDVNHEKQMHLIVVSKDLSQYQHIHPTYKGNGVFTVPVTFPQGGPFQLIADFVPKGQSDTVQMHEVSVKGNKPAPVSLTPDKALVKTVNGKEVELKIEGSLKANQETMLTFNFKDAKTKQPITDLQPYLGAVGHVVILNQDATKYLHVHPMDEKAKGPDAMFHTTFPSPGMYKIWGEFQQNNKVFIVPFVVEVSK